MVWNIDANGNFTSAATGILSATSFALESLETTFGEDLNGDGTTGPTTSQIATNGVTNLDAVANQFQLNPAGGGTGPFLTLNGSPVTNTQFPAGYTPVGAVQTATGYEVAFWNNDVGGRTSLWSGTPTPTATSPAPPPPVLSGASTELAGVEGNFGDGKFTGATVGPAKASSIADNGTTTLNSVGNLFELTSDASGTGPLLELNGSVVTQGQFAAGPVGALWTGDGYEVAFGGTGRLAVWNTDANGNFTSVAANTTSVPEVAGIEAAFGDGNIAGVTGAGDDGDSDCDQWRDDLG